MKKILSSILSLAMIFIISTTAFASESTSLYVNESEIEVVASDALTGNYSESTENSPKFVNEYRYRKVDVSTYKEWSPFKRVSDNVEFTSEGGSIEADRSASFGTVVSGNIGGLNIATNVSLSSRIGYVINAEPNSWVYMGYRVKYSVEEGTRECYDMVTGKVVSTNKYTVKTPLFGDYKLINYSE